MLFDGADSVRLMIGCELTSILHKVSRVLGGCAERIAASAASPSRRETTSSVYHVITGSGRSVIGDKEYFWEEGDTFCIPSWYKYRHFAGNGDAVYLYRFDDRPMMDALGFHRSEEMDLETLVSD